MQSFDMLNLNNNQNEAVMDFDHNLLLLAAAGSGKTRVITQKIIQAIRSGRMTASEILAITFTNKAAAEMLARTTAGLKVVEKKGLTVKTFHSFALSLLMQYPSKAGLRKDFKVLAEDESISLIAKGIGYEMNRNEAVMFYNSISRAKEDGIGPDDTDAAVYSMRNDFPSLFKAYENAKKDLNAVDFDDMIYLANRMLEKHEKLRENIRSRYRMILVDEYQDTSASQFRFLRNIAGEDTQLVVVGDDDQSIYRFRGARVENILTFPDMYPNVKVVRLEQNYRSTASIVNLAASFIGKNTGRHDKTMRTDSALGILPTLHEYSDELMEAERIATEIEEQKDYGNTAVLFRMNAQSAEIEMALARRGIPYKIIGSTSFYQRDEVLDMMAFLRILADPYDKVAFARIVNKPSKGIGKSTIQRIVSMPGSCIEAMGECCNDIRIKEITRQNMLLFLDGYKKLQEEISHNAQPGDIVARIYRRFDLESYYSSFNDEEHMENRRMNISTLQKTGNFHQGGMQGIKDLIDQAERSLKGDEGEESAVRLMTIHSSKGLEFRTVYIIGLEDDILPGGKRQPAEADIEEERRILYVAVTRAEETLRMSYCKTREMFGKKMIAYPSRFIREFGKGLYEYHPLSQREAVMFSLKNRVVK